MAGTETITLRLVAQDLMSGNVSKAIGGLDKLAQKGGLVGSVVQGMGQSFGQFLNPVGLVTKGIGAMTDFLGDSIRAFEEDKLSQQTLGAALEANIPKWNGNTKAIEDLIASRTRLGYSDDEQRTSLAQIVASVQNVTDALAIERTAMDLSRLKGISLADASTILAKAYNGSTTALQRMGIKVAAGTKGMEAITAVQARAAGQAQAYADTMTGATDVMKIGFDEFKESVGGALEKALMPFFNTVVALTQQAPNLDTTLGKLTQHYKDLIQQQQDSAAATQESNIAFDLMYSILTPQDKAIHDFTGTLGDMGLVLGVTRKDLALFTEAALTYGKTLPQIKDELDALVATNVAEKAKTIGYAWQTGMDAIKKHTPGALIFIDRLPVAVSHAVVNMKDAIKSGKAAVIEQFRDLAWQSKHPFAETNYQSWLERKQNKAMGLMKQAAKKGKPGVVAQYQQMVYDIQSELDKLPGYAAAIHARVVASLAGAGGIGSGINTPAYPGQGHWEYFTKKNGDGGTRWIEGRASGGPVSAGRTYRVGENGPETLHMAAGGGGYVVPNSGGGGGGIHIHVHGILGAPTQAESDRIARALVPAIRRVSGQQGVS